MVHRSLSDDFSCRFGLLDAEGRVVLPVKYDKDRDSPVLFALYDGAGKALTAPVYAKVGHLDRSAPIPPPPDAVLPVWIGKRCDYVNLQGKEVVPVKHAEIRHAGKRHFLVNRGTACPLMSGDGCPGADFGVLGATGLERVPFGNKEVSAVGDDTLILQSGCTFRVEPDQPPEKATCEGGKNGFFHEGGPFYSGQKYDVLLGIAFPGITYLLHVAPTGFGIVLTSGREVVPAKYHFIIYNPLGYYSVKQCRGQSRSPRSGR